MTTVLFKALAFVFIIFLGYALKKIGFFKPDDYKLIAKIALQITLPAAVVSGFASSQRDNSLFILVLIAFCCTLIMFFAGWLLSRKRSNEAKAFYMINATGYNIGAFTMPFVQNFLGPFGVIATCMFDTGNSIMVTGGAYAATSGMIDSSSGQKGAGFRTVAKKLFTSVPFDTYMIMLIMSVFNIPIPQPVAAAASTIGAANGFVAMLMIGTMFEIHFKREYLKDVTNLLFWRYIFSFAAAAFFYFLTPFPLQVRQVLAIVVCGPIPAMAPAFTEKSGGKASLASFANSLSIIISLIVITCLVLVMHIEA